MFSHSDAFKVKSVERKTTAAEMPGASSVRINLTILIRLTARLCVDLFGFLGAKVELVKFEETP